jgi:hypothetical protein
MLHPNWQTPSQWSTLVLLASGRSTEVVHSTTDHEIKGLNPGRFCSEPIENGIDKDTRPLTGLHLKSGFLAMPANNRLRWK